MAHFSSYYRVWQSSRNNIQESTSYSYHYCINYRNNFSGPKRLLKVQVFEKRRQSFQWKKIDQFSACYRVWQNSRNNLKRSLRYSGFYLGSNKINSLGPKMLLKNKSLIEKRQSFQWKKFCGFYFLVLCNMKNVRELFIRVSKVFDIYRANDKMNSSVPKRSIETNISKNSSFLFEKKSWPFFPRIIECDNPQGTLYNSPQAIFTITV